MADDDTDKKMADDDKDNKKADDGKDKKKADDDDDSDSDKSPENILSTASFSNEHETDVGTPVLAHDSSSTILNFYSLYGKNAAGHGNMEAMETFVYMNIPPDGGYAWIILLMSFLNQLIIDGMLLSVGRLLPSFTKSLNISEGTTAFIASVQLGLYYISGPIAGALVNKVGFRSVSFYGCIATVSGTVIASFSQDVISMVLFYGVLVGSGYGLIFLSAQMIVGFYFEKYRAIAIGISCAGSGCGVLIFSPLTHFFVQNVGWRYTLRIHGLFTIVVLILSIFYRPVEPTRIGRYVEPTATGDDESLQSIDSVEIISSRYSKFLTPSQLLIQSSTGPVSKSIDDEPQSSSHQRLHSTPEHHHNIPSTQSQVAPQPSKFARHVHVYSPKLDFVDRFILKCCGCCRRKPVAESIPPLPTDAVQSAESGQLQPPFEPQQTPPIEDRKSMSRSRTGTVATAGTGTTDTSRKYIISVDPLDREDIFYTGNPKYNEIPNNFDADNISVLPGKEKEAVAINYTMSVTRNTALEIQHKKGNNLCHINPKFLATLNLLFDLKLIKMIEFQCLLTSASLFVVGLNIPFIYLTAHALIEEKHSNYLLSVIGLTNIILRVSSGIMAFSLNINALYLSGIPMVFCGIFTFISGHYGRNLVAYQYLYCVIFGTGTAFFSSLRALIYVDLLGLDKLTNAFGLSALAMGVSTFIGTNIAGQLTNLTGNTNIAFMFSGVVIFLAGLLTLFLPTIIKIHKSRKVVPPPEVLSSRRVKFLIGKSKSSIKM